MNIQEAIRESLKTKKMIARKNYLGNVAFIPTNDVYDRILIVSIKNDRLPGRGWQPDANDLIADDWYVTDIDYQNFIN